MDIRWAITIGYLNLPTNHIINRSDVHPSRYDRRRTTASGEVHQAITKVIQLLNHKINSYMKAKILFLLLPFASLAIK